MLSYFFVHNDKLDFKEIYDENGKFKKGNFDSVLGYIIRALMNARFSIIAVISC
jgi:hypothetical protein